MKAGNTWANPTNPACAALPVVCSTNQGSATITSALPISETTLPASSAMSGQRSDETAASV